MKQSMVCQLFQAGNAAPAEMSGNMQHKNMDSFPPDDVCIVDVRFRAVEQKTCARTAEMAVSVNSCGA